MVSPSYKLNSYEIQKPARGFKNRVRFPRTLVLIITNIVTLSLLAALSWAHYSSRVIDWAVTSEVVKNFGEVIAITVAGFWAYYRFVKGRIVKSRLELALSGRLKLIEGRYYLVTTGMIKNVGTSDFRIREEGANLRIATYPAYAEKGIYTPKENGSGTFPIFPKDRLLEPGESIQNERITTIDHDFVVVGVQMFVDSDLRRWYTSCIVEKPIMEQSDESKKR